MFQIFQIELVLNFLELEACNYIKKRDSSTGAFSWILQKTLKSLKHFIYRMPPDHCSQKK